MSGNMGTPNNSTGGPPQPLPAGGSGGGGGTLVAQAATWNPGDKQASIVLSNGLLTNSIPGGLGGGYLGVGRATLGHATGKWYFEYVTSANANHDSLFFGLANMTESLTGQLGDTGHNSIGFRPDAIQYGGGNIINGPTFGNGEVVACAFDADARLVWFLDDNGNWNNSSANNPGTGIGGIDISALTGTLYAAYSNGNNAAQSGTVNFGASTLAHALPSGFTAYAAGAIAPGVFSSLTVTGNAAVAGNLEVDGTLTVDTAIAGAAFADVAIAGPNVFQSANVTPGSPVALTGGGATDDICHITLGAGDWLIFANVGFAPTGGALTDFQAWITNASASVPARPNAGAFIESFQVGVTNDPEMRFVGQMRVTGGATYYLSVITHFTGSAAGFGFLGAIPITNRVT